MSSSDEDVPGPSHSTPRRPLSRRQADDSGLGASGSRVQPRKRRRSPPSFQECMEVLDEESDAVSNVTRAVASTFNDWVEFRQIWRRDPRRQPIRLNAPEGRKGVRRPEGAYREKFALIINDERDITDLQYVIFHRPIAPMCGPPRYSSVIINYKTNLRLWHSRQKPLYYSFFSYCDDTGTGLVTSLDHHTVMQTAIAYDLYPKRLCALCNVRNGMMLDGTEDYVQRVAVWQNYKRSKNIPQIRVNDLQFFLNVPETWASDINANPNYIFDTSANTIGQGLYPSELEMVSAIHLYFTEDTFFIVVVSTTTKPKMEKYQNPEQQENLSLMTILVRYYFINVSTGTVVIDENNPRNRTRKYEIDFSNYPVRSDKKMDLLIIDSKFSVIIQLELDVFPEKFFKNKYLNPDPIASINWATPWVKFTEMTAKMTSKWQRLHGEEPKLMPFFRPKNQPYSFHQGVIDPAEAVKNFIVIDEHSLWAVYPDRQHSITMVDLADTEDMEVMDLRPQLRRSGGYRRFGRNRHMQHVSDMEESLFRPVVRFSPFNDYLFVFPRHPHKPLPLTDNETDVLYRYYTIVQQWKWTKKTAPDSRIRFVRNIKLPYHLNTGPQINLVVNQDGLWILINKYEKQGTPKLIFYSYCQDPTNNPYAFQTFDDICDDDTPDSMLNQEQMAIMQSIQQQQQQPQG